MTKLITNPKTGEAKSKTGWAIKLGMDRTVLDYRLKHWTLEEALNTPVGGKPPRMLTNPKTGETISLAECARRLGMHHCNLTARIDKFGWDLERAMTKPPTRRSSPLTITHPQTGETMSLSRWAIKLNKSVYELRSQLMSGLIELALTPKEEMILPNQEESPNPKI